MSYPIVDLHCDLLGYLAAVDDAHPANTEDIGCAIPYLQDGNVRLQVTAFYSGGTPQYTQAQGEWYKRLLADHGDQFRPAAASKGPADNLTDPGTGIVASIENASGLCGEDEPLDKAFERLDFILHTVGSLLYISLTHHGENRFGGGNNSEAGLKDDGGVLLNHIAGRKIAVDLSHTSDALAHGIINHIDKHNLDLPIIASHSNFRTVFDHRRNLPDELAQVVIERQGLIGVNFVRAFVHPDDPSYLTKHILHGFEIGGGEVLCFGADYFCFKQHPDQNRRPFFFDEHENAGRYQPILQELADEISADQLQALASGSAIRFLKRLWSE